MTHPWDGYISLLIYHTNQPSMYRCTYTIHGWYRYGLGLRKKTLVFSCDLMKSISIFWRKYHRSTSLKAGGSTSVQPHEKTSHSNLTSIFHFLGSTVTIECIPHVFFKIFTLKKDEVQWLQCPKFKDLPLGPAKWSSLSPRVLSGAPAENPPARPWSSHWPNSCRGWGTKNPGGQLFSWREQFLQNQSKKLIIMVGGRFCGFIM